LEQRAHDQPDDASGDGTPDEDHHRHLDGVDRDSRLPVRLVSYARKREIRAEEGVFATASR
jgi:hypothetical protein